MDQILSLEFLVKNYQKHPVTHFPTQVNESASILTVLVFAFNHEKYIAQCLDSILSQNTEFNFHIYLAEDDSTDGTKEICKKYALDFPENIKLVSNPRINKTMKFGKYNGKFNLVYSLLNCNTPYIAFCDGDDYWLDKEKIQKQVSLLEKDNKYNVCISNIKMWDVLTQSFLKRRFRSKLISRVKCENSFMEYLTIPFSQASTYVFRNGFNIYEWIFDIYGGDHAILAMASGNKKICFLDEYLSVYRLNVKNSSDTLAVNYLPEIHKSRVFFLQKLITILPKKQLGQCRRRLFFEKLVVFFHETPNRILYLFIKSILFIRAYVNVLLFNIKASIRSKT